MPQYFLEPSEKKTALYAFLTVAKDGAQIPLKKKDAVPLYRRYLDRKLYF